MPERHRGLVELGALIGGELVAGAIDVKVEHRHGGAIGIVAAARWILGRFLQGGRDLLGRAIGKQAARDLADRLDKAHIVLDLDASECLERALAWLGQGEPATSLCIAGPRESEAPGIYAKTREFLRALLDRRIST